MLGGFDIPLSLNTFNDPAMLLGNNSEPQICKHIGSIIYCPGWMDRVGLGLGWELTLFQYDMTRVTANCLPWHCDLSINYFVLIIRKKVKIAILRKLLLLPPNMLLRVEGIYSQKAIELCKCATEWSP